MLIQTQNVYCEVRTESLRIIVKKFLFQTVEARCSLYIPLALVL
jgi:hypothetical protein